MVFPQAQASLQECRRPHTTEFLELSAGEVLLTFPCKQWQMTVSVCSSIKTYILSRWDGIVAVFYFMLEGAQFESLPGLWTVSSHIKQFPRFMLTPFGSNRSGSMHAIVCS